jgi:hypothetical protein
MLGASVFMTAFLWWKLGSSSEYRGTGSVERFEEFQEVTDDKKDPIKDAGEAAPVVGPEDRAVEVRGVELDDEGRERR